MTNPVSTAASAVTIAARLAAGIGWLRRMRGPKPAPWRAGGPAPHAGLEVRPIRFSIDLTRPVPYIEISFYAVNYCRREFTLRQLDVTRFTSADIPALDGIPLATEHCIPAQSSRVVFCRRNLLDSEARAVSLGHRGARSGTLSYFARAHDKRREVPYGPVSSIAVDGAVAWPAS